MPHAALTMMDSRTGRVSRLSSTGHDIAHSDCHCRYGRARRKIIAMSDGTRSCCTICTRPWFGRVDQNLVQPILYQPSVIGGIPDAMACNCHDAKCCDRPPRYYSVWSEWRHSLRICAELDVIGCLHTYFLYPCHSLASHCQVFRSNSLRTSASSFGLQWETLRCSS